MRSRSLAICALVAGVVLSVAVQAQPGSGTRWEISMEMAGMGFATPKQTACLSKDVNEAPPAEKDCTLLEHHSTGNHHVVKMQCPQGLMELDQTRTADSMISLMKMTDSSGEVTEMTMKGTSVGDCDYTVETAKQKRKIAGLQRQADAAEKRSKEEMARMCADALDKMQGAMFTKDGFCQAQQAEYCKRVNTLEGYQLLTTGAPVNAAMKAALDEQVAVCGTRGADLLRRHCQTAISQENFNFARAYCPDAAPRLCTQALSVEDLGFLAAICHVEARTLAEQQCAGRKYSSEIPEKYRDFCAGALSASDGAQTAGASAGAQDAGSSDQNQPATAQEAKKGGKESVKQGVKEGVKSLKKVFGF